VFTQFQKYFVASIFIALKHLCIPEALRATQGVEIGVQGGMLFFNGCAGESGSFFTVNQFFC